MSSQAQAEDNTSIVQTMQMQTMQTVENAENVETRSNFVRRVFFTFANIHPLLLRDLLNYASNMYDEEPNKTVLEQKVFTKGSICNWMTPIADKRKIRKVL